MKMFNKPIIRVFLFLVITSTLLWQVSGCTKDDDIKEVIVKDTVTLRDTMYYDEICPVRGLYVGTSFANGGGSSNSIYTFHENNYVVGRHEVNQGGVSFGGYRATCDSVIWKVYYTVNQKEYLLKGKFSNNGNTISGSFQNLGTASDFGTFTMNK